MARSPSRVIQEKMVNRTLGMMARVNEGNTYTQDEQQRKIAGMPKS
jgi:hypothetical protein